MPSRGGHYPERTSLAAWTGGDRTFTTGAMTTRWPTKAEVASAATIVDWTGSNEAMCSSACGYVARDRCRVSDPAGIRRHRVSASRLLVPQTGRLVPPDPANKQQPSGAEATSDQRRTATGVWRWRREASVLPARRARAAAEEVAAAAAAAAAAEAVARTSGCGLARKPTRARVKRRPVATMSRCDAVTTRPSLVRNEIRRENSSTRRYYVQMHQSLVAIRSS